MVYFLDVMSMFFKFENAKFLLAPLRIFRISSPHIMFSPLEINLHINTLTNYNLRMINYVIYIFSIWNSNSQKCINIYIKYCPKKCLNIKVGKLPYLYSIARNNSCAVYSTSKFEPRAVFIFCFTLDVNTVNY